MAEAKRKNRKMRVPKMAEMIADQIRKQIILGEVEEGSPLPSEAELMEEYGVSRPTLREAYRLLESELLISVTRGARGGARVNPPDIQVASRYAGLYLQYSKVTLEDVQNARITIEPPSVRRLAERQDSEVVIALRDHLKKVSDAIEDLHDFTELATSFNDLLLELSGNKTLSMFTAMIHDICQTHAEVGLSKASISIEDRQLTVDEQSKLIDLIEQGDGVAAEQHWRKYLEDVIEVILTAAGREKVVDLFA